MSETLRRAIAPLALMGAIFYVSAQPDPGPDVGSLGGILAHAVEYAVLAALWAWTLAPILGRRALLAAGVISLLYAISDELHQIPVSGRDGDPLDVLVDGAGITVALWLTSLAWRRAGPSPRSTSPRSDRRPS